MDRFVWKESDLPEKELMPGVWLKSIYLNKQLVTLVTFKPFAQVGDHAHNEQQISVVIEGKMDMTIDGIRYPVNKGDIVVVPPRTLHSVDVSARGAKAVETWNRVIPEYIVEESGQA
jgi:quercetin dioxygenase-like cupin family protein